MQCNNCLKMIPDTVKACEFCEAPVEEWSTEEMQQAARDLLERMSPELQASLRAAVEESPTAEDFANRILSGPCPKCGSEQTGTCEDDVEIGDACMSRCYECGQFWCTLCSQLLEENTSCGCCDEEE